MARCHFSKLVLTALLMAAPLSVCAGDNVGTLPPAGQKLQAVSFGAAGQGVLDDYLSSNVFSGPALAFSLESVRKREGSENLYRSRFSMFNVGWLKNASQRGRDLTLWVNIHDAWLFRFFENSSFTVLAGPEWNTGIGAVYTMRSTNNPAQLKLNTAAGIGAQGTWRFQYWKLPKMALRLNLDMPLLGVNFSPEYGQQYYEIWQYGQLGPSLHLSWPGNLQAMSHRLSLDIPVRKTQLRIGYDGDFFRYNMDGLKTRIYTHSVTIGVVRRIEFKYNGK